MKGDLDKDGKMSSYEKKRDAAIKKSMAAKGKKKGGAVKKMGGGMMKKDPSMMGYKAGGLRAAAAKLKKGMKRGGIKK